MRDFVPLVAREPAMQPIMIEKPYRFVPPYSGKWWPAIIQRFKLYDIYLRRSHGIVDFECRGTEHLEQSLRAGHGILLTPNHCRLCDPVVMGFLARRVNCLMYAMASWHLFNQDRFTAFAIRRMGGFSVYREGIDRQAINTAIRILESAERPLIIFPEGTVSRTNDQLHALLDGVAFIARTAAKRRAKKGDGGKIIVHPVALKYRFLGDLSATLGPVLTEIEQRLSWQPQPGMPLPDRIAKLGLALLALKEIEYFGQPQSAQFEQRLQRLIDRLLCPLEQQWLGAGQSGPTVPRVKTLRMQIMPEMVRGELSGEQRAARWKQLADMYLAQQVSCYPHDYLQTRPSVDRLLETVERFEEDLTDKVRVHGPMKVILQVAEPIEVSSQRKRDRTDDLIMVKIESELQRMLGQLALESPVLPQFDSQTS